MRTLIISTLSILILGTGTAYQYPDILLAPLLSGDVDYADIFLNEDSTLTHVDGDVMLNGHAATIGTSVAAGDSITTGVDSYATITYFEDSVTRLEPETSYRITAIAQDATNPLSVDIHGQLAQGTVWNKVIRPLDPDNTFSVGSATTAATIRGSAFAMSVDARGETTTYASEHDLSLEIIDPKTKEIITTIPVTENNQASITRATSNKLKALQKKVQENPQLTQEEVAVIRSEINQLTQKKPIPEKVRRADWYRNERSADITHIKDVEQRIMQKKKVAIKVSPQSPLYVIQKHSDTKRIARAGSETEHSTTSMQVLKRQLIEQDIHKSPVTNRQATLQSLKSYALAGQDSATNNTDFALLEKGYATIRFESEEYELKKELLTIRADIEIDPVEKKTFQQRAIRQEGLDKHDAIQREVEAKRLESTEQDLESIMQEAKENARQLEELRAQRQAELALKERTRVSDAEPQQEQENNKEAEKSQNTEPETNAKEESVESDIKISTKKGAQLAEKDKAAEELLAIKKAEADEAKRIQDEQNKQAEAARQIDICLATKLHDTEKEDVFLEQIWGAEREYDSSWNPIIQTMSDRIGTMVRSAGIRLRPGDAQQGIHDAWIYELYGDYPRLIPEDNLSFIFSRVDVYRPEAAESEGGQQLAWAVLDPVKNPAIMDKIIAYYANPNRLIEDADVQNDIRDGRITREDLLAATNPMTESEVRALYVDGVRVAITKISPGTMAHVVTVTDTGVIGQADVGRLQDSYSAPVNCQ